MSTYLLNLTSDDRLSSEVTDNFTIQFNPPLLINGNWQAALESAAIWYSWYNISPDYNNQTFRYYNGVTWKDIIIPAGLYTIDDINAYVQSQMKANGDYTAGTPDVFYITLEPNFNTFKLRITVSNSYQVDLTVGLLYVLFGYDPIIVTTTQEGVNNINITNGVNRIQIHIDFVTCSYRGATASDVIYSFSANGPPSSLLEIKPNRLLFIPLNKSGHLDNLRIRITDQLNRPVSLNGEEVSITLYLRRV